MDNITVKDKSFKPFISEESLQKLIKETATKINYDYRGKSPIFIGVLNGSFMFFGDLLKHIDLECTVSFVKLSSYQGVNSTGTVNELIGLNEDLRGKDVILVEDIVDTGNTIDKLYEIIKNKEAKSIRVSTLLYKPKTYNKSYEIDYVGIEIPNEFVVGYGLDYDGLGRNLNSIYVLNEEL